MQRANISLLIFWFIASCTLTPASEPWIMDRNTGCKVRNPYLYPDRQLEWSGKCVNGFAEGNGTISWYKDGVRTAYLVTCIDSANYTCNRGGGKP